MEGPHGPNNVGITSEQRRNSAGHSVVQLPRHQSTSELRRNNVGHCACEEPLANAKGKETHACDLMMLLGGVPKGVLLTYGLALG